MRSVRPEAGPVIVINRQRLAIYDNFIVQGRRIDRELIGACYPGFMKRRYRKRADKTGGVDPAIQAIFENDRDFQQRLGGKIRAARIKAGLTQRELAFKVGYDAANPISRLELGQSTHIDLLLIRRIARCIGASLQSLISDDDLRPYVALEEIMRDTHAAMRKLATKIDVAVEVLRDPGERTSRRKATRKPNRISPIIMHADKRKRRRTGD